jgi:cell division protein ZapA
VSEPVNLRILDREFLVSCDPAERDGLQGAANLLDQRLREARNGNRMASLDRLAIMVALNLAHELLQAQTGAGQRDHELKRALGELNRKIDGLLDAQILR